MWFTNYRILYCQNSYPNILTKRKIIIKSNYFYFSDDLKNNGKFLKQIKIYIIFRKMEDDENQIIINNNNEEIDYSIGIVLQKITAYDIVVK